MIINVYKPKGWTSFDVVSHFRKKLNTKKIGHTGTLDPMAEGVLILVTDHDTKNQASLTQSHKQYYAEIALGLESDTFDLEGKIKITSSLEELQKIQISDVTSVLDRFKGEIQQKVPAYSAVKVKGIRLYKKARAGLANEEELPVRTVNITKIELKSFTLNSIPGVLYKVPVISILVDCSSGTYIRRLASDIGKLLGVGGVLVKLVRTKVGDFNLEDSTRLN